MKNTILVIVFISLFTFSCKGDKKADKTETTKTEVKTEVKKDVVKEVKPNEVSYTFNKDAFTFNVTGYGAKDKSYVVSNITFKKFDIKSKGQLLGTTLSFDPLSIDTSKDMNNGQGGEWPAAFAAVRNGNITNGFFNNLAKKGNVTAEVVAVNAKDVDVKVTLNGVSKTVKMVYSIDDKGMLSAKGKIDLLDFSASDAFKKFEEVCTAAFHQGKTWSEIGLNFTLKTK